MTGAALNYRLAQPPERGNFRELAANWRDETVEFTIPDMGAFAESRSLLNKVRGAFGNVLVESASTAVRRRLSCSWSPVCGAEIFFGKKPGLKIGKFTSEISKPFILSASRKGNDLVISLKIFGFAREWSRVAAEAISSALQTRVKWHELARDNNLFVPVSVDISKRCFLEKTGINIPYLPEEAVLEFLSPIDAERGNLRERPQLLLGRLARRIILMARWQDMRISEDFEYLEECWSSCLVEWSEGWYRGGGGSQFGPGGHKLQNRVLRDFTISIRGNMEHLWPLLLIGERTNVGRGASLGLGAYKIIRKDAV